VGVDVGAELGEDGEPDVFGADDEVVVLVVGFDAGVEEAVFGGEGGGCCAVEGGEGGLDELGWLLGWGSWGGGGHVVAAWGGWASSSSWSGFRRVGVLPVAIVAGGAGEELLWGGGVCELDVYLGRLLPFSP